MGSGADHSYKAELEERERARHKRKHIRWEDKAAFAKHVEDANVCLATALAGLRRLDNKIFVEEGSEPFLHERDVLKAIVGRLEEMKNDIRRAGFDLRAATEAHEHEYRSKHPDEGCFRCGVLRGER